MNDCQIIEVRVRLAVQADDPDHGCVIADDFCQLGFNHHLVGGMEIVSIRPINAEGGEA